MLVEVDNRHAVSARLARKLTSSAIAHIDEGKISKVDANEWNARSDVVLESLAKNGVVAPDVSDGLELVKAHL